MQLKIYLFFYHYFMFSNALIGRNVRPAENDEFPFVVAIVKYFSRNVLPRNLICTGTLISRNDILTSEHCMEGHRLTGIEIIIGSSNLSYGIKYYPEWWISYDQWAVYNNIELQYSNNDISFLNLFDRVPDIIQPALLSIVPLENLYGYNANIAGWGLLHNNIIPMVLHTGTVVILSESECRTRVANLMSQVFYIDARTVCTAANPYLLLRNGDSGGPLFLSNFIIAVNFGTAPLPLQNFHPEKINLHILITFYMNFIDDLKDYY